MVYCRSQGTQQVAYCTVGHLLSKCALLVLGKKPLMELARYLASGLLYGRPVAKSNALSLY